MKDILLISNIEIHNANALSSPYTVGFPAMSAWLGFMHALERKMHSSEFEDVKLSGLIVSCIDMHLHTFKGRGDYVSSIVSTANPLNEKGERSSFIAEARCDMEVSLAIECVMGALNIEDFTNFVKQTLHKMKMASGDILHFESVRHLEIEDEDVRQLSRYLMPGFCLVSRQELMQQSMQEGQDAIDALLDYIKLTRVIEIDEEKKIKQDKYSSKEKGWLMPISVGYQAISDLEKIEHQRDSNTPHRFVENIVTLGEFKMPYHFDTIDEMMWRYEIDKDNGLYLCKNNFKKTGE